MSQTAVNWMILFHILAALWLTAGVFGGAVVRAGTRRATDLREKVMGLRLAWRLAMIYTVPGAIVAGLLGFGLVSMRKIGFGAGWVQASIVIYLLMLVVTLAYLTPRLKRTVAEAERSLAAGRATPEFEALASAKLPGILADANALGIVILTVLMVLGPRW